MQTHRDEDMLPSSIVAKAIRAQENLKRRAEGYAERGDTSITAGVPGEAVLAEEHIGGVHVLQRPDDPDCLRASVGGLDVPGQFTYLVFRGDPVAVEEQLRRAFSAICKFNTRRGHHGQQEGPTDVTPQNT
jgi:hypothetical protein